MPLSNAVLDFHPLGIVDTPAGPRQHVVLVAAQRDMVEQLLAAVRGAGLQPVGVDLSAFALIRSLYRRHEPEAEHVGRVLYLNVDGLTNLAIAEGTHLPLHPRRGRRPRGHGGRARRAARHPADRRPRAARRCRPHRAGGRRAGRGPARGDRAHRTSCPTGSPLMSRCPRRSRPSTPARAEPAEEAAPELTAGDADARVLRGARRDRGAMSFEMSSLAARCAPEAAPEAEVDADVRMVLENGVREISGEVRNSLDFHRSAGRRRRGLARRAERLRARSPRLRRGPGGPSGRRGPHRDGAAWPTTARAAASRLHRLAVAAGLATTEVHAMRAVNLIPIDQRGGSGPAPVAPKAARTRCSC